MLTKICLVCGKRFIPSRKEYIHCSHQCSAKGRRGKTAPNQKKFLCKQCGKIYYKRASRIGKTKFCSKRCQSLFMKKQTGKRNPNYKDGRSFIKSGNSGKEMNYRKGRYYENKTRKILESKGYFVTRSAASKGAADLIAINKKEIVLIQVKSGKSHFSPRERNIFIKLVVPKNCRKELWSWLSSRPPTIKEF